MPAQYTRYRYSLSPLHKYSSLHRVHNAAELGLLVGPSYGPPNPPGEGGGQPVSDLRRNSVRLQLLEVILSLQTLPESIKARKQRHGRETKQNTLHTVTDTAMNPKHIINDVENSFLAN